jgi:hypothetical protein
MISYLMRKLLCAKAIRPLGPGAAHAVGRWLYVTVTLCILAGFRRCRRRAQAVELGEVTQQRAAVSVHRDLCPPIATRASDLATLMLSRIIARIGQLSCHAGLLSHFPGSDSSSSH